MTFGPGDFSIEVPPPDQRDPDKCEMYETEDYQSTGCEQFCSVEGYFGYVRIQDPAPREVASCKQLGTYCRLVLVNTQEVNVTYTNGRCDESCTCMPYSEKDDRVLQAQKIVAALISSKKDRKDKVIVTDGMNQYGSVKVHLPSAEFRNQTDCEEYESSYYNYNYRSAQACKSICSFQGNLGNIQFEGKPRELPVPKFDGYYCEMSIQDDGTVELINTAQVRSGQCCKGECLLNGCPSTP